MSAVGAQYFVSSEIAGNLFTFVHTKNFSPTKKLLEYGVCSFALQTKPVIRISRLIARKRKSSQKTEGINDGKSSCDMFSINF